MSEPRGRAVVLLGALWPGNEQSGPNRTILNWVATVPQWDFAVVSRDRPFGRGLAPSTSDASQLPTYHRPLPVGRLGLATGLVRVLRTTPHDVLVINSLLDVEFSLRVLMARRLRLIPARATILSPRGELGRGALSLKPGRKRIYFALLRRVLLTRDIALHATSEAEADDIRAEFPTHLVVVAPNPVELSARPDRGPRVAGEPLRLAFVGRVTPVKNLDLAIEALGRAGVPAVYRIFGPEQDAEYSALCRSGARQLPSSVRVEFLGALERDRMLEALADVDALLMPSKSENFGHAIFEALSVGLPVIIGAETPWSLVTERGAGVAVDELSARALADAIIRVDSLDAAAWTQMSDSARRIAEEYVEKSGGGQQTAAMLDDVRSRHENARGPKPMKDARELFDDKSQEWHAKYEQGGALTARLQAIVRELAPGDGQRLLDFGCASGSISRALAEAGFEVTGCDISGSMIDTARRLTSGSASVHFDLLDESGRLPYADDTFDVAISMSVLEYVPDAAHALGEIHRVLRPGGRVVVTVPNTRHPVRRIESALKRVGVVGWASGLPLPRSVRSRLSSYANYLNTSKQRHDERGWREIFSRADLVGFETVSFAGRATMLELRATKLG